MLGFLMLGLFAVEPLDAELLNPKLFDARLLDLPINRPAKDKTRRWAGL
ncbi:MAG: hypothetical protein M3N23_10390 [Pseudomonadota bacterium]|nr:hypothetical protein [Pseudomonadota bacterium]